MIFYLKFTLNILLTIKTAIKKIATIKFQYVDIYRNEFLFPIYVLNYLHSKNNV